MMKDKISALLGILYLLGINSSLAAATYRVINVTGNCSLIDDMNEAKSLTKGVFLPTNSKIIVAKGGQLSLQGEASEIYHLSEGSSFEVWREQMVLLQGTMWVQSASEEKEFGIETMNSVVQFKKSEFVLSFDEGEKKSQLFVISGNATIANAFMREKREQLVSGEISYVQKDFQQGMPRRPTLIGKESLAGVFKKFRGITPGDENFKSIIADDSSHSASVAIGPTRAIASVSTDHEEVKGIYFIPKIFSAPMRQHPIKERAARAPASLSMKNHHGKMKPIKVYNYPIVASKNSWGVMLGEDAAKPVPSAERSISSVIEEVKKTGPVAPAAVSEPDYGELMRELRGVSSQNNEVY